MFYDLNIYGPWTIDSRKYELQSNGSIINRQKAEIQDTHNKNINIT